MVAAWHVILVRYRPTFVEEELVGPVHRKQKECVAQSYLKPVIVTLRRHVFNAFTRHLIKAWKARLVDTTSQTGHIMAWAAAHRT